MKTFEDHFEEKRKRIEGFLESLYADSARGTPPLREAIRYSLLAGGKRLRPILVGAAAEAIRSAESTDDSVLRVAAAVEMIHTYSLIHDDLPAMDNDDLRRGRPTSHKKFGEAIAILAGDSLLTDAFALMAGAKSTPVLLEVIRDIAVAAGGRGMAWGQAIDLECQGKKITPAQLEDLHRHKTGCLIEVSVASGAKLAGANAEKLEKMRGYGRAIGLAFQVADDILDVEGATERMGKNVGGDRQKEKATYPSIIGLAASKQLASQLVEEAVAALSGFGPQADFLRGLARYVVGRSS